MLLLRDADRDIGSGKADREVPQVVAGSGWGPDDYGVDSASISAFSRATSRSNIA